jgi:GTP-binding protein LepA
MSCRGFGWLANRVRCVATLNYLEIEPQKSDIVKVDILINGNPLDALSFVCHRSKVLVVDARRGSI